MSFTNSVLNSFRLEKMTQSWWKRGSKLIKNWGKNGSGNLMHFRGAFLASLGGPTPDELDRRSVDARSARGRRSVDARSAFGRRGYFEFQGPWGRTIFAQLEFFKKQAWAQDLTRPRPKGQANYITLLTLHCICCLFILITLQHNALQWHCIANEIMNDACVENRCIQACWTQIYSKQQVNLLG